MREQWRGTVRLSYLYVVGPRGGDVVKIGRAQDVRSRLSGLQIGQWQEIEILETVSLPWRAVKAAEALTHKRLATDRLRGEWFKVSPERAAGVALHAATQCTLDRGMKNRFDLCNHFCMAKSPALAIEALSAYRTAMLRGQTGQINRALLDHIGMAAYGVFRQIIEDGSVVRDGRQFYSELQSDFRLLDTVEQGFVKALNFLIDHHNAFDEDDSMADLIAAAA